MVPSISKLLPAMSTVSWNVTVSASVMSRSTVASEVTVKRPAKVIAAALPVIGRYCRRTARSCAAVDGSSSSTRAFSFLSIWRTSSRSAAQSSSRSVSMRA